jgi:hypothetical protein
MYCYYNNGCTCKTVGPDCVTGEGEVLSETIKDNNIYCYYDNGLSFKMVNDIYITQTGEVLFAKLPTEAELLAAFPGRVAAIKAQKIIELNAEYQTKYDTLSKQYPKAFLADGETVSSVQAALAVRYKSIMAAYAIAKEAILNG